MRRRQAFLAMAAILAVVAVARHPSAEIEILTHRAGDPAPQRIQAAVDLGIVAVRFVLTWTAGRVVS